MATDAELLRQFVQHRDEDAFTELVNRHVDLVYSSACRATGGDANAAKDVTQLVFVEMARKAGRLTRHAALAGWLYTTVRYVSANLRRSERRRAVRERKAHDLNESSRSDTTEPTWESLCPVLDDALHELNETDRGAVVLRFFADHSLRQVGAALGLTENAARMRVDRALEKLRVLLSKRGVISSAPGLAVALTTGAASAAPESLAASVATGALAPGASSAATALTNLNFITVTKLKFGMIGAMVIAGLVIGLLIRDDSRTKLRSTAASEDLAIRAPLPTNSTAAAPETILVEAKVTTKIAPDRERMFGTMRTPTISGQTGHLSAVRQPLVTTLDVIPRVRGAEIDFSAHLMVRDSAEARRPEPIGTLGPAIRDLLTEGSLPNGGSQTFTLTNRPGEVVTWKVKLMKVDDELRKGTKASLTKR